MRLNAETQQKMVLSVQDEQSELNRQITQLQLAIQEKDSRIQYVILHAFSYLYRNMQCMCTLFGNEEFVSVDFLCNVSEVCCHKSCIAKT